MWCNTRLNFRNVFVFIIYKWSVNQYPRAKTRISPILRRNWHICCLQKWGCSSKKYFICRDRIIDVSSKNDLITNFENPQQYSVISINLGFLTNHDLFLIKLNRLETRRKFKMEYRHSFYVQAWVMYGISQSLKKVLSPYMLTCRSIHSAYFESLSDME
jgi:hypothetical protein